MKGEWIEKPASFPALAAGDRPSAGLGGCPDRAGLATLSGGAGLSRAVDAAPPGANPGGDSSPSRADESITQRLKEALALIDIKVLDHLIIGGTGYTSLARQGLL